MRPNLDPTRSPSRAGTADEATLAGLIADGDHVAFEILMRRNNRRLFRVARAILRDDVEAEDALQDAYLDAYRSIGAFRGGASLSTWLTRIVVNQALMRLRKHRRERLVVPIRGSRSSSGDGREAPMPDPGDVADDKVEAPSTTVLRAEVRRVLERRIDELPVAFRAVFVLREVEDMTVQESADALGIPEATVRTRLFRARALLREALARDLDAAAVEVFPFEGARCDRIVARVHERLTNEKE